MLARVVQGVLESMKSLGEAGRERKEKSGGFTDVWTSD